MELRYGGQLNFGDLIAISNGNYLHFGFYAGTGSGTLQYYSFWSPTSAYDQYENWLAMSEEHKLAHWNSKRYSKGFTSKCIYKSYINAVHDTRIMKITDPQGVFTNLEDMGQYQKATEILTKIGMIKN